MMECHISHPHTLDKDLATKLTLDQMKELKVGDHVYAEAKCGCLLRVRVNGKPQTWKKEPLRVEVPYKYGLHDFGYLTYLTNVYVPTRKTMFSRHHCEAIAKVIRACPISAVDRGMIILDLVAMFSTDNPGFDEVKFTKACIVDMPIVNEEGHSNE